MNLLIDRISHLSVDDVRPFWGDQFLYNGDDSLVNGFALLVSEDYVDFKLGRVCDDLVDEYSESDTARAVVSDEINRGLHVNTLQLDFQFTLLANFLCKQMIIEVRNLYSDVDVFSMYIERMLPSHI